MDQSIGYYVVMDGKAQGPYSLRALEMLARQKKIDGTTFVCPEGNTEWVAYSTICSPVAQKKNILPERQEEPPAKQKLPEYQDSKAATPIAAGRRVIVPEGKGNHELVKECDGFLSGSILISWGNVTIICSLIVFIIGVIIGFTFLGNGGILNFIVLVSALVASIMIGVSWAAFGYIVRCQATIVRLLAQIADKK